MSEAAATLRLQDVVVDYRRKHLSDVRAVAGASLTVDRGQVHGLVGESGCGKSTLARAATGLVPISSGSIEFAGEPVTPLKRRARAPHLRRLQMVFQDPNSSLNPRRSVGAQLEFALRRGAGVPSRERPARARELLNTVGLPGDAAKRVPSEFSGGQRQRICIARALAANPSVIIADEPISALDASAQAQIANMLVSLARQLDLGVLFISHDLAIVRHVADVVTVMYLGKVVESAPTSRLWADPLHPYTRALIESAPRHDGSGQLPHALKGEIPDPSSPPSGCRFHPRCNFAFAPCPVHEPMLEQYAQDHRAACWLNEPAPAVESQTPAV
jgi:peptide/nickel transport system ATP-binding protein